MADVYPSHDKRRNIWGAAKWCFQTAFLALASSKLSMETLDIFGFVTFCSLACGEIATMLEKVDLSDSLRRLKQLSISLSIHDMAPQRKNSFAFGQQHVNAICQFLQLSPNLEALQLHWYWTRAPEYLSQAMSEENYFFDHITESCQFPSLERLTLRGIYTSEAALISFLRQVKLRSIDMEYIHIKLQGRFRPVFDCLVEHSERLKHIHFGNLFEADRPIFFNDTPEFPLFPHFSEMNSPKAIIRTGVDARKPIEYHLRPRNHLTSCPIQAEQRRYLSLEYGP
ncbi:hypothetical protein LAWI1_G000679 [Lachnellula willkommii]|uniref:F-box domain-containing protein n=1 Tax=Lachnellula willkommii TaxID=215461 RepID=A0A559MLZ2_9HELO|nr:hypothetical protein LAWI1_G000679 [Lachnellula willkommii]